MSLSGFLMLSIVSFAFVPPKLSVKKRIILGVLHVSAHMIAALVLMLLMELGIAMCINNRLLAASG